MPNKLHKSLYLLVFVSINAFSQEINERSWHYVSLGFHPQYLLKPNDQILIFPLNYEYLPKFFKHHYGIGVSLNFNDVKIDYQKEFTIGIRNTFYIFRNEKISPYFGFGVHNGNPKWLGEWYWKKYGRGKWQIRVFAGVRVKITKNYMVFTEYGNYRIGSQKFNLGFGVTRIFNK